MLVLPSVLAILVLTVRPSQDDDQHSQRRGYEIEGHATRSCAPSFGALATPQECNPHESA